MSEYPIAVVVGSLRRDSFNRKLASAVTKLAPPEFSFTQVQIGDLPLYNQDDEASPAESVRRNFCRAGWNAMSRGCKKMGTCLASPDSTTRFHASYTSPR